MFNRCFCAFGIICNIYLIIRISQVRQIFGVPEIVYKSLGILQFCEICDAIAWEGSNSVELECNFLWGNGHLQIEMSIFPKEIAFKFRRMHHLPLNIVIFCSRMLQGAPDGSRGAFGTL